MADIDLQGLDPAAAREVVAGYLRSSRELQRQLRSAREREELWQKRTLLARQAGDRELEQRAQNRLQEAHESREKLSAEDFELSAVIDRLKGELKELRAAPALSGVDAEQLLADLQSIAGEPDATADELKNLQTEHELRELKRRLEAEP
jgi:hypothetical protein